MNWFFIIALAAASSIDNLAVGLSYGVRGIRIHLGSNLIIAAVCFVLSLAGILFGHWIGEVLPGELPDLVGAILLFLIGVRILLLALPRSESAPAEAPATGLRAITNWFSRVIAVEGGRIGPVEALILGVALSANALANAVGAGLMEMPPLAIALSASIGSLLTISLGVALGLRATRIRFAGVDLGQFGTLMSGVILVGLAVVQFW